MSDNGTPPGSADKQLGEIVSEVTQKASLLVREEIELAKAEIQVKTSRIVKGTLAFSVAGFFALLMVIFLFETLSWGFTEWFDLKIWVGFGFTTGLLLFLTIVAALIGRRLFSRGTPPTPEYAIEEAQATKKALEEARA